MRRYKLTDLRSVKHTSVASPCFIALSDIIVPLMKSPPINHRGALPPKRCSSLLAEESGIPYQSLINLWLRNCAEAKRKLHMTWSWRAGQRPAPPVHLT